MQRVIGTTIVVFTDALLDPPVQRLPQQRVVLPAKQLTQAPLPALRYLIVVIEDHCHIAMNPSRHL